MPLQLREPVPLRLTDIGQTPPEASLSLSNTQNKQGNCDCVVTDLATPVDTRSLCSIARQVKKKTKWRKTFSGLNLVDGHFSSIQDHILPLPALASLPIPANTQRAAASAQSSDDDDEQFLQETLQMSLYELV